MYKSCLFLTGGAVEKQAGTTDLEKLGGLARRMPVTAICFIVAAASISGVPPFNGFFSKELVYDGALERGWIFYAAALLGSFLTAASFLKLGHAAFFGKPTEQTKDVKEAPWPMLVPMIVLAALCVLFGVANQLPLGSLVQPAVGEKVTGGASFAGFPASALLVGLTLLALALAVLNHIFGVRRTGRGLGAVDHIHHAPVLASIYAVAEKGQIDPYTIGRWVVKGGAVALWGIDRAFDWVYETVAVGSALGISRHQPVLPQRQRQQVRAVVPRGGGGGGPGGSCSPWGWKMSHLLLLVPFAALILANLLPRSARPAATWIAFGVLALQTVAVVLQPLGLDGLVRAGSARCGHRPARIHGQPQHPASPERGSCRDGVPPGGGVLV